MNNSEKSPLYILSATPLPSLDIPKFFEENTVFFELLRNPPKLRYTGWNMLTLDYPHLRNGESWEVRNGDRKTFRLYRDGSFVAVVYADSSFLGWGISPENFPQTPRVNPLALIEYTFEFVRLYSELLVTMPSVEKIEFRVEMNNTILENGNHLYIVPKKVNDLLYSFEDDKGVVSRDFSVPIPLPVVNNTIDAATVAFRILTEVFGKFNIPSTSIPYAGINNSTGERFVDTSQINAEK